MSAASVIQRERKIGTDLTGFTKRGVSMTDMKVPRWDDSVLFPKEFGGKRLESWPGAPVKRTLGTEEFGLQA